MIIFYAQNNNQIVFVTSKFRVRVVLNRNLVQVLNPIVSSLKIQSITNYLKNKFMFKTQRLPLEILTFDANENIDFAAGLYLKLDSQNIKIQESILNFLVSYSNKLDFLSTNTDEETIYFKDSLQSVIYQTDSKVLYSTFRLKNESNETDTPNISKNSFVQNFKQNYAQGLSIQSQCIKITSCI